MKSTITSDLRSRLSKFNLEDNPVLIQIPQFPLDLFDSNVAKKHGYFAYPPQGLLYISASMRKHGINSKILDLNFEVLEEAQKSNPKIDQAWQDTLMVVLEKADAPFVGVSFMFEWSFPNFQLVCKFIRARKPDACIAAGGVAATSDPDRLIREGLVDIVFSHEGESAISSFYSFVRRETSELPINISFLDNQGVITHTPRVTGGNVDLDITREFKKIPIQDYYKVGALSNFQRMNGIDIPYAAILAKRGCRNCCSFCSVRNFNGQNVRVRDVENVVREMEFLHTKFGTNIISSIFNFLFNILLI